MSAAHAKTLGMAGIGGFRAAVMPSEAVLVRLHRFIDDISPFELTRAATGGPKREPETNAEPHASPWDDPALWMLMLH